MKIAIPNDASSIPDGGAMDNGVLLSASELEKRGYFVNSPSDDVPILAKTKEDDEKDKNYRPLKHSHSSALDDEVPEQIYGSDGEEIMSETHHGRELVRFHIYTSNHE